MVLSLKRWKSRSSPGIAASEYGLNPFTCLAPRGRLRLRSSEAFALQGYIGGAGWSSPVARQAHNLKVTGSNPVPATNPKPAAERSTASGRPPRESVGGLSAFGRPPKRGVMLAPCDQMPACPADCRDGRSRSRQSPCSALAGHFEIATGLRVTKAAVCTATPVPGWPDPTLS